METLKDKYEALAHLSVEQEQTISELTAKLQTANEQYNLLKAELEQAKGQTNLSADYDALKALADKYAEENESYIVELETLKTKLAQVDSMLEELPEKVADKAAELVASQGLPLPIENLEEPETTTLNGVKFTRFK